MSDVTRYGEWVAVMHAKDEWKVWIHGAVENGDLNACNFDQDDDSFVMVGVYKTEADADEIASALSSVGRERHH